MAEISELERLYTPSYWTKRFTREVLLQRYEEITTKLSEEARRGINCELNVSYGDAAREKFDIFGASLPNDAPIFIFIHGGYWQEGEKDAYSFVADKFFKSGCKTIIVGYTLCPEKTIPEIVEEIRRAIRKCLKYAIDNGSRGISIGGHSAGAQLVASLLSTLSIELTPRKRDLIKSVLLIGGIYNLVPLVDIPGINTPLKLTQKSAEDASPMFKKIEISEFLPKIFIVVGADDSPAFVKQSQLFSDELEKQGIPREYVLLEGTDHFELAERMREEDYECVRIILKSLRE